MGSIDTLIISPKYHPLEDGLGQYTKQFYLATKQHVSCAVLTSKNIKIEEDDKNIHYAVEGWGWAHFSHLIKHIKLINSENILFQYVPFMYARRGGINFSLILLIIFLRIFSTKKIQIMYHELNYPFELNLKAMVMFFSHHLMLYGSVLSSHSVFCSTEFFVNRLKSLTLGFKRNIYHLPVGSNIQGEKLSENEKKKYLVDYNLKEAKLIGLFGSFHPSKTFKYIFETILEVKPNHLKFIFMGASLDEIIQEYKIADKNELMKYVIGTGFLKNNDVHKHLQLLDGGIFYFMDGVSTRRGSIIPFIDRGIPMILTKGDSTEEIFLSNEFMHLLPIEPVMFKTRLKALLQSENWPPKKRGVESQNLVDYFSWARISKIYLKLRNI